jgi:hypothetical protein
MIDANPFPAIFLVVELEARSFSAEEHFHRRISRETP